MDAQTSQDNTDQVMLGRVFTLPPGPTPHKRGLRRHLRSRRVKTRPSLGTKESPVAIQE